VIKFIYEVSKEQKDEELQWLRSNRIYPATEEKYDWAKNKETLLIAVIVSSEQAILIKLRHNVIYQDEYNKRQITYE